MNSGLGKVAHAGGIVAVGGLGFAEQHVGVHGAVAGEGGPLDRPVVEEGRDVGRVAGIPVQPGGELGRAGADDQELAADRGDGFPGDLVDGSEDAQGRGQCLARAGTAVGAGGFVERGTQVGDEMAIRVAAGAGDGGGQVLEGGRVEQRRGTGQDATGSRPAVPPRRVGLLPRQCGRGRSHPHLTGTALPAAVRADRSERDTVARAGHQEPTLPLRGHKQPQKEGAPPPARQGAHVSGA
ncbi:hypothetical protein GCM10020000_82760 [Streptomyces olivoverticillatus]